MGTFSIQGGFKLKGDIHPQGAKNEALQVICACLLTSDEVIIDNIPEIMDVIKLIDLLSSLGVKVDKERSISLLRDSFINCLSGLGEESEDITSYMLLLSSESFKGASIER